MNPLSLFFIAIMGMIGGVFQVGEAEPAWSPACALALVATLAYYCAVVAIFFSR